MSEAWKTVRLGDIADWSSGKFVPKSMRDPNGNVPIMGANGTIGRTDTALFDEPVIVVGRVGACGEIHRTNSPVWVSDNALVAQPTGCTLNFLFLALQNVDFGPITGGSIQPLITQTAVKKLTISLPPLAEQERIVDLIGSLDDAIEAAEGVARTARRAAYEVLSGELGRGVKTLGHNAQWPLVRLGEACVFHRGASWGKAQESPSSTPESEEVVGIGVTSSTGIDLTKMKHVRGLGPKTYRLKNGDILIVASNGNLARVGNSYLVDGAISGRPFSAFQMGITVDRAVFLPEFLAMTLSERTTQESLQALAAGSTGIRNLKSSSLSNLMLPQPPQKEQERIVELVGSISAAADAATGHLASLRALRAELLNALLSGAHAIPETYDQPALPAAA